MQPLPGTASRSRRAGLALLVAAGSLVATAFTGGVAGAAPTPDLRPYQVSGIPTKGRANAVDAPLLAPGRYRDSLATADENLSGTEGGTFYRVMLRKGDTPYLSATLVPPARPDSESFSTLSVAVYLRPVDRGNTACSFTETGYPSTSSADLNTATALVSPGRVGGPDWDEDCPVNAPYGVQVLRTGDAYAGTALPVELGFHLEPSATATGVPGPASSLPNLQPGSPSSTRKRIAPTTADSFDDAPLLTPGQYRDTFTTGETRYYRVHLDWGQRLAYTVTVDQDPAVADADGSSGNTSITNPLREPVAQPGRAHRSEDYLGSTGGPLTGSTLVPARYTNRESDDDTIKAYSVDGDYYLVFSTDYATDDQPVIHVGFTVQVAVLGTKETGPTYSRGGPLPASAASGGPSTVVLAVVLGGGILVLAVILAVVLGRRRNRSAPKPG